MTENKNSKDGATSDTLDALVDALGDGAVARQAPGAVAASASGKVQRSPYLQKILEELQKLDRLFDYNVPPGVRGYGNEALFRHLQEVYSQQTFVVSESGEVKKYLGEGDLVIMKTDFEKVDYKLKTGARGIVKRINNDGRALVAYEKHGSWNCLPGELLVHGRPVTFFDDGEVYEPPVRGDKLAGSGVKLRKHHLVEYNGESLTRRETIVPAGTLGMVFFQWTFRECNCQPCNEYPLYIVWQRGGKVKNALWYNSSEPKHHMRPDTRFSYDAVSLVVRNPVDFPALAKELSGEKEEEKPGVLEEAVP